MVAMPGRRIGWRVRAVLALVLLPLTAATGDTRSGPSPAEREFLDRHWRRPIALQGEGPARFSAIERSLAPTSCGTCHPTQFTDWKTTRHARALGPGVAGSRAFVRSEFCASCHQFGSSGLTLNGKPLENTYEEWRASPAAREGRQCQDCHMPDRRHLWRGIHDPDMVKSGIRISFTTDRPRYRPGAEVRATLSIARTNLGHFFPTYVTPMVVVRAVLTDAQG